MLEQATDNVHYDVHVTLQFVVRFMSSFFLFNNSHYSPPNKYLIYIFCFYSLLFTDNE